MLLAFEKRPLLYPA